MKRIWIITVAAVLVCIGYAFAQSPRTIRYDGRLEQNGRAAVDGNYDLYFALFDAVEGGRQLWPSTANTYAKVTVRVSNGMFVAELGGAGMESLGASVFASPQVFVQTKVGDALLSGRRVVGAVPFAVRADNGVPPGAIQAYAGTIAPPGWLLCDGSAVSRNSYPELFGAIGIAFGQGDMVSTFNLPDLRGRTLVGAGSGAGLTSRALGSSGGAETVALSEAQMPAHSHTGTTSTDGAHSHTVELFADNWIQDGGQAEAMDNDNISPSSSYRWPTNTAGSHSHTFTTSNAGGGAPHENMPPFVSLNYVIKI